jgi:hypothetical protein
MFRLLRCLDYNRHPRLEHGEQGMPVGHRLVARPGFERLPAGP